MDIDDLEQELLKQLSELERSYRRAAEPILRELARLESLKPPKPFIITPAATASGGSGGSPDITDGGTGGTFVRVIDAAMPATRALLLECEQVPNIDRSPMPWWRNKGCSRNS